MGEQLNHKTNRPNLLWVLLALTLGMVLLTARPLLAQSEATVSAGNVQIDESASGTVPLTLTLPDGMLVGAITVGISYDPTAVTYDTYTTAVPDQFPGTLALCNPVDSDGVAPDRIDCSVVAPTGISAPLIAIADLTFTGGDTPSETALDVSVDAFVNPQGEELAVNAVDGRIAVGDPLSVTLTDSADAAPMGLIVAVLLLLVVVVVVGLLLRNRNRQAST